jgi:N,N'-diacetyllegionaminate synthase
VRIFNKDTSKDVVVIAEIGVNHKGSIDWILDMLPKVKDSGADAIKFQLFTPDLYSTRSNLTRYEQISAFYISEEVFLQIKKSCDSIDLPIFATALSHDWVQFIADTCGVIKIASGDFTFAPTVEAALNTAAQVIISSGATSRSEVIEFVKLAKQIRLENSYYETIAMLHCISSYPPPIEESNLSAIADLNKLTELTIGFSSHFLEDAPLFAALGLGARIFEIHVTDDRSRNDIRDHSLSRTPGELKNIISSLNGLNLSLLSGTKAIQKSELDSINSIRKGIVYSNSLSMGHELTASDFNFARPLNAEFPNIDSVIGRRLKRNVEAFFPIVREDLE